MRAQLQPVTLKMQAWPASGQAPSHWGWSASPHCTARHSHEPVPAAAPHRMPAPQLPVHFPSLNVQSFWPGSVVDVVLAPPPSVVVLDVAGAPGAGAATFAGAHR